MSNCVFCGKPAGFFHNEHHECAEKHKSGRRQVTNLILEVPSVLIRLTPKLTIGSVVAETRCCHARPRLAPRGFAISGFSPRVPTPLPRRHGGEKPGEDLVSQGTDSRH